MHKNIQVQKNTVWKRKGAVIENPWTESAMIWCMMCRFREGPWTGKITKDLRSLLAKLIFRQEPNLENVSFSFLTLSLPAVIHEEKYLYQYSSWEIIVSSFIRAGHVPV